jgi:hypothetical protein
MAFDMLGLHLYILRGTPEEKIKKPTIFLHRIKI